ncbi:MAG: LysM peptidoglycan-binding domain-containing protein [Bacteroidetes bacterium]|jgi:LysM repeat protein|nr:LysM peptidoglycan-binding domain-containing protein [Bacteroidota bacterium]
MYILRGLTILALCALLAAGPARGQEAAQPPTTYVVKSGDTLYSIAQRFGVSVERLQRLNDLSGTTIEVGQTLVVRPPRPPAPTDTSTADAPRVDTTTTDTAATSARPAPSPRAAQPSIEAFGTVVPATQTLIDEPINRLEHGAYVVRPGDTFYSVAARFGTTGDSLFTLNGRRTDPLPPGRVLRLPPRFALPAHTVQPSDSTLYVVAAAYGVSVRALQRVNDLDGTTVAPGTRLRIPGRTAPEPAPPGALSPPDARGPVARYPAPFEGRLTASGARYDPDQLVVSHPELPFGHVVLLTNAAAGRSTFARVVDRGPIDEGMLVDVSAAVAERLGLSAGSNQPVALRVVR